MKEWMTTCKITYQHFCSQTLFPHGCYFQVSFQTWNVRFFCRPFSTQIAMQPNLFLFSSPLLLSFKPIWQDVLRSSQQPMWLWIKRVTFDWVSLHLSLGFGLLFRFLHSFHQPWAIERIHFLWKERSRGQTDLTVKYTTKLLQCVVIGSKWLILQLLAMKHMND